MKKTFNFNKYLGEDLKIVLPGRKRGPITLIYEGSVSDINLNGCVYSYSVYNPDGIYEETYKKIVNTIREKGDLFSESEDPGYVIRENQAVIIGRVYDSLVDTLFYDRNKFTNWAISVGIIEPDKQGNAKTATYIKGKTVRCVKFNLDFNWNEAK